MKTYIINDRILDGDMGIIGISKERVLYHIQEKTEWTIVFTQGDISFVTSLAERYGDSLTMLRVPTSLLIPSWVD